MDTQPGPPPERALREARDAVQQAAAGASPRGEPQPAPLTRAVAHVLDDLLPVPGTSARVGVDPFLSLVPGAGSTVGTAVGGVVLVDAVRLRAPVPVLARMVTNALLDWLLGLIPFAGPFFDVAYRSNRKNIKLLNRTIEDRALVHRASVRYWFAAAGLLALLLVAILAVPLVIILGLGNLLTGAG